MKLENENWTYDWAEYVAADLTRGLVAWYPFDGNASDMSRNGNHGTVNGATLGTDRFGEENKAYSFDGVDDYVSGGDWFNGITDGSYSLWLKTSLPGGNYYL